MSKIAIHQLVHTLSYGDAISSEVVALQRCFHELDIDSDVYAINIHPHYKKQGTILKPVKDYKEFPHTFEGEVILHYSLGSPLNELYAKLTRAKRTLVYHNLTPSSWFKAVNPRIVRDIEQGTIELPKLCSLSNKLLADSSFNAGEIRALGFAADVLELSIDPHRWSEPRNEGIFSLLRSTGAINVVHVGRLAPNKCIEDIIKTFYFLHHYVEKNSHLWLAGIDIDTELYSFGLKRLVHEFGLDDSVHFTGCMADSEVRALYEAGSVYLCMSEHEGFCLPVVEAMSFGLPVVAFSSSAVTETVGQGGVLITEKRHSEIAELINEICKNGALRNKIIAAGHSRVAALSFDKFAARIKELFVNTTLDSNQAHAV